MKSERFLVLDGMRGIAALAVLYWHAGFGFGVPYPGHGYLAVDFFFALSGFVVAHAYEARIRTGLPFTGFAWLRLIRLYPMIFIGAVFGGIAFDPGWSGNFAELGWLDVSIALLLPFGLLFHLSSFPVNTPVWSLFFELCANAVYWFNVRTPGDKLAKGMIFLAASAAVLAATAHMAGSLRDVGVSSPLAFLAGFSRVGFSFMLGVMMFRFAWHEHMPRVPDFVSALALAALLAIPACGWWYDMLCVMLVFPALLAAGARATATPALCGVWRLSGALSYPLYVIHEPILRAIYRLHGNYLLAMVVAVALAYALLRFYDEPVRAALARRRKLAKALR